MSKFVFFCSVFIALAGVSGCASVRPESKSILEDARRRGLPENKVEQANPVVAGGLNILPGIGNIYLAINTDEKTTNWVLFPVNLLTWPVSILWGVPQAAIDANTANRQATADFYQFNSFGKSEFNAANQNR